MTDICETGQPRIGNPSRFGGLALKHEDEQKDDDNDEQCASTDIHL